MAAKTVIAAPGASFPFLQMSQLLRPMCVLGTGLLQLCCQVKVQPKMSVAFCQKSGLGDKLPDFLAQKKMTIYYFQEECNDADWEVYLLI